MIGHSKSIYCVAAILLLQAMLAACGGAADGASSVDVSAAAADASSGTKVGLGAAYPYAVGGSVSGLIKGTTFVLRNNGGDALTWGANGGYMFPTRLANGASYSATVYTQPAGQTCTISNATGTIRSASVTNVNVACVSSPTVATYSVGGSVSGLNSGASLVLRNNNGDNLTRGANGAFTFPMKLANAATYAVTVYTQPVGQTCTVTNARGIISAANVANVGVACITSTTPTAKLIFKSNFGPGVSLSEPYNFTEAGARQSLTGLDAETGFSWPIKALDSDFSGVQMITTDFVTDLTIKDYAFNKIKSMTGPNGSLVNALFQNIKKKAPAGTWDAQSPLIIQRPWNKGDVSNIYITYWYKNPASTIAQLDPNISAANEVLQFQFKTGGLSDTMAGDYRISLKIVKDKAGNLSWNAHGDNQANNGWKKVEYWVEENHSVAVPVDEWYQVEIFWHRSSGSDGRYWAAINGEKIIDHHGPIMGKMNLPITRMMVDSLYSGGHGPIEGNLTGLEMWDGFPCGVGVSCYVPPAAP